MKLYKNGILLDNEIKLTFINNKTMKFILLLIILLLILRIYFIEKRMDTFQEGKTINATFLPEGELKVEEPKINKSMGCNIYWRAKGYPCYDIK